MNKGKFKTLNKPWKEILYSASGFGPNLLMVLMGAYLSNAVNPAAIKSSESPDWIYQTISGTCLVIPLLFSILWMSARAFDGFIDIPFASITDSLRTKYGNRRIPIAICVGPMILSFAMCWWPVVNSAVGYTIWLFIWAMVFFSTYTMCLIAFYGSLSNVCVDEKQRTRVSSYKSFFDTISYALVYALVPVILSGLKIHIDKLAFFCLPLMLTMLVPLFMIKEGNKWESKLKAQGYDITPLASEKPVRFGESIKLTFKNKPFVRWILVNACSFFGLQLFLVSMNALIIGGMGLNGVHMTILNTLAFGPVPLMLYVFNVLKQRKGIRFSFQVSLLSFAVAILGLLLCNRLVMGNATLLKLIVGGLASILGSYAIASFFLMSYLVPAQISTVEEQLTKKNHSAMYFAAQAVTNSAMGATSGSLLWENIKNLFISTEANGVVTAKDITDASLQFNVPEDFVFNLGVILVPIITSVVCVLGFILAFKMPRSYSHSLVGQQIIGKAKYETIKHKLQPAPVYRFESVSLTVYNALWVLSVTVFGFIWYAAIINDVNTFAKKRISRWWVLAILVFFPIAGLLAYRLNKEIDSQCLKLKTYKKSYTPVVIIFSILYLNCFSLSVMQRKLNRIADIQNSKYKKEGKHA